MIRKSLLTLLFWLPALSMVTAAPVEWTGYGNMELSDRSFPGDARVLTFRCETPQRASDLQSKLLADYSWDGWNAPTELRLDEHHTALNFARHGLLAILRRGDTVYAAAAPDEAGLRRALDTAGVELQHTLSTPEKRHPRRLDFFDLEGLRFSLHGFNLLGTIPFPQQLEKSSLDQRLRNWAKFPIGFNDRSYFRSDNLFDAEPGTFWQTYLLQQAAGADRSLNFWLGVFGAPPWFRNRFPNEVDQYEADSVPGWGQLQEAGSPYPAYSSPVTRSYAARFNRTILEALLKTAPDTLSSLRIASGRPGDEDGFHSLSTDLLTASPRELEAFRAFLRKQGYTLAALGERYYGDAGHYQSWEEVRPLPRFAYYGDLEHARQRLDGPWFSRVADRPAPGALDDSWTPNAPGSVRQLLWNEQHNPQAREVYFRCRFRFEPRPEDGDLHLVVGTRLLGSVGVWLNGRWLGEHEPEGRFSGPFALPVKTLLQHGDNELILRVPRGVIHGPVFLSAEKPVHYPYGSEQRNAHYRDTRQFGVERIARNYGLMASDLARIAPDYPVLHTCGSGYETAAEFGRLKREVGIAGIHQTGSESSFRPWWPGLGYALGIHSSHEEAGQCNDPARLSREFHWSLLSADSSHNFIYDAILYAQVEQQTKWFSRNRRLLELFGKAWWQPPKLALFRAAAETWLFPEDDTANTSDLGRGSLQDLHYGFVYLTESELKNGIVSDYPVVIDGGNRVYDPDLIAALRRYVEAGGIFITQSETGRHAPLRADADPIAELTGFRAGHSAEEQLVTVETEQPVFSRLAGGTFPGRGLSLNWIRQNLGTGANRALEPIPDFPGRVTVLARWQDGSIALALRQLGKGWILACGSSFWRCASDRGGSGITTNGSLQNDFLRELLTYAGIQPEIECAESRLWAKRQWTKNGLQEWLVLWNRSNQALTGVELTVPGPGEAGTAREWLTGGEHPLTADAGGRHLQLDFAPGELKVLMLQSHTAARALELMLAYKQKFFDRSGVHYPEQELPELPPARDLVFSDLEFQWTEADSETPPATGSWQPIPPGFWEELGYPARGTGYYRTTFTVPEEWSGRAVNLQFAAPDFAVFSGDEAVVYLNGREAARYAPHMWINADRVEVTPFLKPGRNELLVKIRATRVRGGWLGQFGLAPLESLAPVREIEEVELAPGLDQPGTAVRLPLAGNRGRILRWELEIPADWRGKNVLLELDGTTPWGVLLLNGRAISFNSGWPLAGKIQLSLLPHLRFGERNTFELWPYSRRQPTDFMLRSLRIGTAPLEEVK